MSKNKPGWYYEVTSLLRSYPMWKKELSILDKAILATMCPSSKVTQSFGINNSGVSAEVKHDELSAKVELIEKAVDMLEQRQKQVITLRYFNKMTIDKVCDTADIPRTSCYREHEKAIENIATMLGVKIGMKLV